MLLSLLLYLVVDARISGIVAVAISACSGESVKLLNMSFTLNDSVVSLYASKLNLTAMNSLNDSVASSSGNVSKYNLIAMWYKGKVDNALERASLDEHGHVLIHNINQSDERKYIVMHRIKGNRPIILDVQLTVWVAPANSCRPQVTRDGNTLIASLQVGTDCGKPEAVPYWLEYSNIIYNSKTKATLTPGKDAGTYYACIETHALSCARIYKPSDFCTSITTYESSCQKPSTDCTHNVALAVLSLVVLFTTVVGIWCLCRKRSGQLGSMGESHPIPTDDTITLKIQIPSLNVPTDNQVSLHLLSPI